MRYEIRRPDGVLCGKFTTSIPAGMPDIRIACTPVTPYRRRQLAGQHTSPGALGAALSRRQQTIVLEPTSGVTFDGKVIPTLILKQGKRTWLNGLMGYSRA